MDFWRSEAYSSFFNYLDATGGFYYERWGDAPVHSIGAALLANRSQVHFFKDVGYRHPPFQRCPQGALHAKGKCWCDPDDSFGEFELCHFVRCRAWDSWPWSNQYASPCMERIADNISRKTDYRPNSCVLRWEAATAQYGSS
jgi:hypothetical protein